MNSRKKGLSARKALMTSYFVIACVFALMSGCGGSSNDPKYVALGASDATGIGAIPPTNGYVFQIEDGLDDACEDFFLFNLGIPAAEADVIVDTELEAATRLDPSVVTIWIGSNDLVGGRSVEDFQSDLQEILQETTAETGAVIFIANLPMLTLLPRFQDTPDPDVTEARVNAFNSVIEFEAQMFGGILVDLSTIAITDVLVSEDGFHPSNEGHETIATLFLNRMIPRVCPESAS